MMTSAPIWPILTHLRAAGDDSEGVDVESRVGLVEDRHFGFEDRHLQDLVALLLAGETLVEIALAEQRIHLEAFHPFHDRKPQLQHGEIDSLAAERAWRRKLITETPGISWGYWNARKMPALPRMSGSHSVMSSPWNLIDPPVTSYSGLSSTLAKVDLPEPLGPMRAWTSPAATVRSTPLRISIPPSVVTAQTFDLEQGSGHGRSLRRPAGLVLRR